jgi:hypothetical protein
MATPPQQGTTHATYQITTNLTNKEISFYKLTIVFEIIIYICFNKLLLYASAPTFIKSSRKVA